MSLCWCEISMLDLSNICNGLFQNKLNMMKSLHCRYQNPSCSHRLFHRCYSPSGVLGGSFRFKPPFQHPQPPNHRGRLRKNKHHSQPIRFMVWGCGGGVSSNIFPISKVVISFFRDPPRGTLGGCGSSCWKFINVCRGYECKDEKDMCELEHLTKP